MLQLLHSIYWKGMNWKPLAPIAVCTVLPTCVTKQPRRRRRLYFDCAVLQHCHQEATLYLQDGVLEGTLPLCIYRIASPRISSQRSQTLQRWFCERALVSGGRRCLAPSTGGKNVQLPSPATSCKQTSKVHRWVSSPTFSLGRFSRTCNSATARLVLQLISDNGVSGGPME